MTFPHPVGYYGLQLSESTENLICSLSYDELADLIFDLASHLSTDLRESQFFAMHMQLVKWFEDEIDAFSTKNKIALLRWLAERLAWLKSQEKANDAQS
ncbi:hypothetical protein [Pseudanabaena minima]|uniref:hypothetical protein n=1 Tax=Pseudanabaena minima TaxID=890415 RepID=UPI003DAA07B7